MGLFGKNKKDERVFVPLNNEFSIVTTRSSIEKANEQANVKVVTSPAKKTTTAKPKTAASKTKAPVKKTATASSKAKAAALKAKAPKTATGAVKDIMVEQNPLTRKWSIRTSGSTRALKNFDTQREAMEYGKILAKNFKSEIRVKARDGKVRHSTSFKK